MTVPTAHKINPSPRPHRRGSASRLLARRLGTAIEKGLFAPGSKLPSLRELARTHKVSKNIAASAVMLLVNAGLVRTESRRGIFVSENPRGKKGPDWEGFFGRDAFVIPPIAGHTRTREVRGLENVINLSHRMDESWDDCQGFDFIRPYFEKAAESLKNGRCAGLYDEQGLLPLREHLSAFLRENFAIDCSPANILVLSRRMQAYHLVSEVFLAPEMIVAFQDTCFLNAYRVGISRVARKLRLPVDEEGLSIDALRLCRGRRLLFIQPTHSEPTGVVTSLRRRREIAEFCESEGVALFEDGLMDPYAAIPEGRVPIKSLPAGSQSIYLGGISGPMTPGCSLDWLVAPECVIEKLLLAVRREFQFPSELNQMLVNEVLREGRLGALYALERDLLLGRRKAYFQILEHYLSGLARWSSTQCWGRIWLEFRQPVRVSELYRRRSRVDFLPGSMYGDQSDRTMLLYIFLKQDLFEEGVRRLRDLVREVFGL